jgi:hypothetical protein
LTLLLLSSLMFVVWAGWAVTHRIVVYEYSTSVRVTTQVSTDKTLEQEGNAYRVRTWRQQFVEAGFPRAAGRKLAPGQQAVVLFPDDAMEQELPALVTEVHEDGESGPIRAVLRIDVPDEAPDPFAAAIPDRVRVEVGTSSPFALLLSSRKRASPSRTHP